MRKTIQYQSSHQYQHSVLHPPPPSLALPSHLPHLHIALHLCLSNLCCHQSKSSWSLLLNQRRSKKHKQHSMKRQARAMKPMSKV